MNKIVTIAIAIFFVLSIIGAVIAGEETGNYWGEVKAIDSQAKTLAVKPFHPSIAPVPGDLGGYIFSTGESTIVMKCDGFKSLSDLRAGDMVNVTYNEKNDVYIATDINDKSCS
ncbi:MAG: hypothetical protein HQL09_01005 [Nitrospirae bacterium]|nr:hypothetical protein [Nitrospirota bacterium]